MGTTIEIELQMDGFVKTSKLLAAFRALPDEKKNKARRQALEELTKVGLRFEKFGVTQKTYEMLVDVQCYDISCKICPASECCAAWYKDVTEAHK